MAAIPEFDQIVEYWTESGAQQVALDVHDLATVFIVDAARNGYRHTAQLGRALLTGAAEFAFVFHEVPINIPASVAAATLATWAIKGIACSYVIAPTTTIVAINQNRTIAIALIRMSISDDTTPLAPSEHFTQMQIDYLLAWLNDHSITALEFAALFDKTPAQAQTFLLNNPRWRLAEIMHERFA